MHRKLKISPSVFLQKVVEDKRKVTDKATWISCSPVQTGRRDEVTLLSQTKLSFSPDDVRIPESDTDLTDFCRLSSGHRFRKHM